MALDGAIQSGGGSTDEHGYMDPPELSRVSGDGERPSAAAVFARFDEEHIDGPVLRLREAQRDSRLGASPPRPSPHLIGIVSAVPDLPHVMHPFFGPVLAGIKSRIAETPCDLFVPTYDPATPAGNDPETIERCFASGAEGLIMICIDVAHPDFLPLLESDRPLLVIDSQAPIGKAGSVMSNNLEGMASAVRHLHELGRRRIAHITGLTGTRPAMDRLLGFRSELGRLGLGERPEYVVEGDFYHRSAYEQTQRLLSLPDPPDAITAASDMAAVGAIVAIESAGLQVPEDIAVVGFDDSYFSENMNPPLTTVHQDLFAIGEAAAEGILQMIDHPHDPPPAVVLPTELVVRESCGIELPRPGAG